VFFCVCVVKIEQACEDSIQRKKEMSVIALFNVRLCRMRRVKKKTVCPLEFGMLRRRCRVMNCGTSTLVRTDKLVLTVHAVTNTG
jgi:hypothetical protein